MDDEKISLKEYFDNRIDSMRDSIADNIMSLNAKMDLINRMNESAIKKATDVVDERLLGLNGVYGVLKDQAATFALKTETTTANKALDDRIKLLELDRAKLAGMASQTTVLVFGAISIIGFVLTVVSFFTK